MWHFCWSHQSDLRTWYNNGQHVSWRINALINALCVKRGILRKSKIIKSKKLQKYCGANVCSWNGSENCKKREGLVSGPWNFVCIMLRPFAEEVFRKCKNYLGRPSLCKRHSKYTDICHAYMFFRPSLKYFDWYFMHSATRPHELQWVLWQFYCCIWLFSTGTQIQIESETDKEQASKYFVWNKSVSRKWEPRSSFLANP